MGLLGTLAIRPCPSVQLAPGDRAVPVRESSQVPSTRPPLSKQSQRVWLSGLRVYTVLSYLVLGREGRTLAFSDPDGALSAACGVKTSQGCSQESCLWVRPPAAERSSAQPRV